MECRAKLVVKIARRSHARPLLDRVQAHREGGIGGLRGKCSWTIIGSRSPVEGGIGGLCGKCRWGITGSRNPAEYRAILVAETTKNLTLVSRGNARLFLECVQAYMEDDICGLCETCRLTTMGNRNSV